MDEINWIPIESSNIVAVAARDNFLLIKFKGNWAYRYPDLAGELEALRAAESAGRYFHRHIKSKKCEKMCRRGCWAPVAFQGVNLCRACLGEDGEKNA